MVGSFLQLKTTLVYITHNPVDLLFGEELNLCTSESEVSSLIKGMLLVGCKLLLGAVSHEFHLVDETREASNISQLPLTVRSDYHLCITK